jgi:hypothetical protein
MISATRSQVAIRLDRYRGGNVQNCDVREIARFYLVLVDFYRDRLADGTYGSTALLGK